MTIRNRTLEINLERALFASRWILAPFYLGMVFALLGVFVVFVRELVSELTHILTFDAEEIIMLALQLIDLSLTANLVLIVIFAGYENFVSRFHIDAQEDRPSWMGKVDFANLKIKLIASIIAISAIALLRAFLPLSDPGVVVDYGRLRWMVIIHLAFVVSGLLLTTMDFILGKTAAAHEG